MFKETNEKLNSVERLNRNLSAKIAELKDDKELLLKTVENLEKRKLEITKVLHELKEENDELEESKAKLFDSFVTLKEKFKKLEFEGVDMDMEKKMAEMENMIKEMAELNKKLVSMMEKSEQAQISVQQNNVLGVCRNGIVNFKKDNIRNFLNSVKSTIARFEPEHLKLEVLEYAKSRCDQNIVISEKKYQNYDDFEADVLQQFKPARTSTDVHNEITMLKQKDHEPIQEFAHRAMALKTAYLDALFADRKAKGLELEVSRIEEAEGFLVDQFFGGLRSRIRDFIREKANNLSEMISLARSADSSSQISQAAYYAANNHSNRGGSNNRGFRGRGGFHNRGGGQQGNFSRTNGNSSNKTVHSNGSNEKQGNSQAANA